MSEEQLKASQVEIKADTQAEVSDEELAGASGGSVGGGGGVMPQNINQNLEQVDRGLRPIKSEINIVVS